MIPVHKYSSRLGERVRLVVIHTSEGARDVDVLGAYLNRPGVNASYHAAVDDERFETYVDYANACWALRNGNQESDNLCLCGFAGWSRAEWLRHPRMLELTAAWIAQRCLARRLPVVLLTAAEVGAAMRNDAHPGGVCDHHRYTQGTGDGTHWDVGPSFPFDTVMSRAAQLAGIRPPAAVRRTVTEDQTMYIVTAPGMGSRKQDWPTQRVSFGFDPKGGWGGRALVNLHFGFPGGWVHEAKWWVRGGTGVGEVNRPHTPVPLNFGSVAGQERFGGLGWQLVPPDRADELEILFSAPGGVHMFPVYER
ncbi:MAG TPA: hypothetical protein VFQ77_18400 [Pseudonocardiaceae bacterium]|jgi:hypothetical protein|nr:hypothetical protein [Pseudonocardiaceae bacterium]